MIGLLAAWEFRRYSRLPLARPLWMLAAFGLLYALAEWGRLFVPIQERYLPEPITETLWLLRVLLMAAAFGSLLQFGIELLPPRSRNRLRALPPVLFAAWIAVSFMAWIPFVGWAAWLSMLVINIMAITKTLNGESWELPVLAKYAKLVSSASEGAITR